MKIIISPAKKMVTDTESGIYPTSPAFLKKTRELYDIMSAMDFTELKKLLACNDDTVNLNMDRLKRGFHPDPLTPAVFAYDGIQYKYMAPQVFSQKELDYLGEHLIILSGYYGLLRAFDGVSPYRLEMQASPLGNISSLYDFWGRDIYDALKGGPIINLASKEYSKAVAPYCGSDMITCVFAEDDGINTREKATLCKMARGSMVRYMAENHITDPGDMRGFTALGFSWREDLSGPQKYVFVRQKPPKKQKTMGR